MVANTNPKVSNALDVFNAVPQKHTSEIEILGKPHTDVVESHVQGVAKKGDHYLLTHSDVHGESGLLLVSDDAKTTQTIPLPVPSIAGAVLNHVGGCQLIGDYLVIPFEAVTHNVSRVSCFNVSVPGQPVELSKPAPIKRDDHKAGAAGIANVTVDGTELWYLAAYDNGRVDIYGSDGHAFPDTEFSCLFTTSIPNGYESLCLFAETSNQLFGIGFRRDSLGRDKGDLYRVHLDTRCLELLESNHFVTNGLRNVHFRWGAGIDIRSANDLALLSTGR
ncbi:MAG: hypothetical protein ACRD2I_07085, partial [Vicinamibacterales bacterium]